MKKSIAVIALSASSSAMALIGPGQQTYKTICLSAFENASGAKIAGTCDEVANNAYNQLPLLENGCAEGQISLSSVVHNGKPVIKISSCLPPNVAQL